MKITFKPMTDDFTPLWLQWIEKNHVKSVWFIEGYATPQQILNAKLANGYDYPYIICSDNHPIGYIQGCDLYAYRRLCPTPKGLFTAEEPGTFCMDLFIGEENYLNKGYGTEIVKAFVEHLFSHFNAKKILIDPASNNYRAIRCYEKVGFKKIKDAFDGITQCTIMEITKK